MTSGRAVRHSTTPTRLSAAQLDWSTSAPPPVEITSGWGPWQLGHSRRSLARNSITARSSWRKWASPWSAKICAIGFPARATMRVSTSANSHPSRRATIGPAALLPVAMKPVRISLGVICVAARIAAVSAVSVVAHLLEEAFEVARNLGQRIAAELFQKSGREFERDHRLRDDRRGRNCAYVGSLDRADRLRLALDVHRAQRTHQRRQRFEREAHAQRLAGAHAALGAAGIIRVPGEAMLPGVVADFVVQFGPANPARGKSQPELDALGGLQAEQREREAAVEFAIPLHVTAEADRQSGRDDLDDTAERVAGFFARVDFRDNFAFSIRVSDAHLRRFGDAAQLRNAQLRMRLRLGRADARDVTQHVDSEWR